MQLTLLMLRAAAALFAAAALTAAAGPIQLIKDINRSMRPVDERPIAVDGGWVVELCDNYRCLPYFTDATSANTRALMQEHADPSQMKFLTQATTGGYFFAPSAGASRVWRTDGTAAGTMPVAAGSTPNLNVRPAALGGSLVYVADNNTLVVSDGTASSPQGIVDNVDVSKPLVAAGNAVWFFRDLPTKNSLWMTDGTPGFATLVGEFGAANQVGAQFALGNRVVFAVNSQLWVSDGTTLGTLVLAEVGPTGGRAVVRVDAVAYFFTKADGSATTQIWRTDGTPAGTAQVASFTGTLVPGAFAGGDSLAYFRIDNGTQQVWRTDGTAAGTVQVGSIGGGSPFVMVGDIAWFLDYSSPPWFVWRSDGTAAGTATQPFLRGLWPIYALGTDLVLGNVGSWITDGSEAGTRLLEVASDEPSESSQCGGSPAVLGNLVIFAASDALHGCEAWRTDGTAAGTFMLRDATPGRSISAYIASIVRMGTRVYFAVNDDVGGTLWQTDGTTAGTSLVRDAGAPALGVISQMVSAGPTLYFFVGNGALWKSDGTAAGTTRVGTTNFNSPRNMTAVGGLVYFSDGTSPPFTRLWRSDGSPAGTLSLATVQFEGDPFLPGKFVAAGDKLVFGANGKPWVSDGTVAGTHQLANMQLAYGAGMVGSAGGYAIFSALDNGTLPPKVFATDGTAAGTVKLGDHDAYTNASVATGGKLYYSDFTGAIHVTDGTPAGTRVAIAFASGSCCSPSRPLGGDAGTLFFLGQDAAHGYEIWKAGADGVPTLVEDFHPGTDGIDLGAGLDFTTLANGAFLMAPSLRYGSEPHLIDYVPLSTVTFAADFYRVLDNGSTELTVERRGPAAGAASVHWSTENGTAIAGQDFGTAGSASQRSGTLSWASGDATPKKITLGDTHANIPLIGGATHEPDEMFSVRLSAPTGGVALGDNPVATVTITDATPRVEFQATAVTVGETGQNVMLRVVRTGVLDAPASVTWQSIAGTAQAGVDFGSGATPAPQGTLAFAAGEFEKTITVGPVPAPAPYVAVIADGEVEADETFTIKLTASTPGLVGPNGIATVTIRSAEAGVTMATENISVAEGPATIARIRVDRLGPAGSALSVPYQSFDQYAIAGIDYTAVSGTLTWSASDLQPKFIDVPIIDNAVSNPPRDFVVFLLSSSVPMVFPGTAVAIIDNEVGAYFPADVEVSEADGMATLHIARSGSSAAVTTVRWTTGNGSAIAGQDFGVRGSSAQRSGTVSWTAGDTAEKTISIPILQDALSEGPETFMVTLSAPTGGLTLGSPSVATVTIVDDEIPPESAISFVQRKVLVMEDGGPAVLTLHREAINVTLSAPVTVTYSTSPGTALAGSDYTSASGTLTWAAADASDKTISIAIVNDSVAESHESFKVTLATSSPGAIVSTPEATVTIIDDDDAFPKYGVVPAGWTIPASATSGWHGTNDPGAYEGVFSLRSDAIDDGEAAQVEVTRAFAAGNVTFRLRVSSEADFDKLRFFVDGVEKGSWSGTAVPGWTLFSTPITAGSHTLRWSYEKDGSASVGQDAAWIDAVVLP